VDLNTFIVSVFCLLDDRLKGHRIRGRGPNPKLSDSEVITIEVVGEFLGIDTDKGIYTYFKRHYGEWFPALREIHRTTFTRQAANLFKVKEKLWQHILRAEFVLEGDRHTTLVRNRFFSHTSMQKEPLLQVQSHEGALRSRAGH
jgi:hypothetical protein